MVERKMWKALEAAGVTRVDQVGVPFDPHVHEADTTRPADHPAKDHTVGAVPQPGYRMGDALIRPARAIVSQWQGDEGRGGRGGEQSAPPGDSYPVPGVSAPATPARRKQRFRCLCKR